MVELKKGGMETSNETAADTEEISISDHVEMIRLLKQELSNATNTQKQLADNFLKDKVDYAEIFKEIKTQFTNYLLL